MRKASAITAGVLLVLSIASARVAFAQTYTPLATLNGTNGSYPNGSLIQASDGNYYGTTLEGGANAGGTVFQVTPSGVITDLASFAPSGPWGPEAGVVEGSDGKLYGTVSFGGLNANGGAFFSLTPGGLLTYLYYFCGPPSPGCTTGGLPGAIIQGNDGNFYGADFYGTNSNSIGYVDTIFQITPSGQITTLYDGFPFNVDPILTEPLVQGSDGNFYGTTVGNGSTNWGSVYEVTPTGAFTTLYSFCSLANCLDGSQPYAGLVEGTDGNFYGTTAYGGLHNNAGTVFRITPSGTLTTLYSFCAAGSAPPTCPDGSLPVTRLIQGKDGNFYGVTVEGGTGAYQLKGCAPHSCGTIFQITPSGQLTTLHSSCSLPGCSDGSARNALLQGSDSSFYGTAGTGGGSNNPGTGVVFSLSLSVALAPTFTPSLLSFGNEAVNTTSNLKSVTIKNVNTGEATLDFSNFAVTPPFAISANTCGATLAAGKTCKVNITFMPTVLGAANGTLSVADNAPGSPQTVALSGTGLAQVTVTPDSLTFSKQKVGTTSGVKYVTLKNNLSTTLTGIVYSTTGPFAVSSSTCGTTLDSNQTCKIGVTFSPTETGTASGALRFTDSANNSPQRATLTGTGD